MRHRTLVELADGHGVRLPEALRSGWPPQLRGTDERGWFRFQRLYDIARSVLRSEEDVRRLVLEAAQDDRREGSGWLEIQVDPSGYATRFGGVTAFTELVQDAAAWPRAATGVGVALVVAANRTRHPLDARTLARLAVRHAGDGPGVRRRFRPVQRRAARAYGGLRAGLCDRPPRRPRCSVPHGGELRGADSVRTCLDALSADRVGHGVRAVEDPALLERIAQAGVALEVCPACNVALGVHDASVEVPLHATDRRRGPHRARGRRPAAVRIAADRAVRARPRGVRVLGRAARGARTGLGAGLAGPRRRARPAARGCRPLAREPSVNARAGGPSPSRRNVSAEGPTRVAHR